MIRGDAGDWTAVCENEGCGTVEEGGESTFKEFVNHIRQAGWKVVKTVEGWKHYCCDECSRD